jgi:hypothetical protein
MMITVYWDITSCGLLDKIGTNVPEPSAAFMLPFRRLRAVGSSTLKMRAGSLRLNVGTCVPSIQRPILEDSCHLNIMLYNQIWHIYICIFICMASFNEVHEMDKYWEYCVHPSTCFISETTDQILNEILYSGICMKHCRENLVLFRARSV